MNNGLTVKKEKVQKKAKFLTLERKQNMFGYVFCLPVLIGLVFVYIPVLVQSLIYSFSSLVVNPKTKAVTTEWVGGQNYNQALFVEEGFLRTVVESIGKLFPQIFIILIFAFFMANILNQNFFGRSVARVIFFIPVIISSGIMHKFDTMSTMLDTYQSGSKMELGSGSAGTTNANIFNYAGLKTVITEALNNETLSGLVLGAVDGLYSVITASGVQMLVFLSGLQSISTSMYEAAKVEGATGWEVFWKISFPMISPLILVNLIYTVIDLFLKADNEAIIFINGYINSASQYELASAFSWIYTIVVLLFVGIAWLLVKKLIVYQD